MLVTLTASNCFSRSFSWRSALYVVTRGFAQAVIPHARFARLHEVLQPLVVIRGMDAFPARQFRQRHLAAHPFHSRCGSCFRQEIRCLVVRLVCGSERGPTGPLRCAHPSLALFQNRDDSLWRVPFTALLLSWVWRNSHSTWYVFRGYVTTSIFHEEGRMPDTCEEPQRRDYRIVGRLLISIRQAE
jgi:hypothetical protein